MIKRAILVITVLTLAAGTAYKATAQEKFTIDKIAAVVGNSIILYSEVEEFSRQLTEMKRERGFTSDRNAMVEALEELMTQKLLYNQALIDSIEINQDFASEQADEYMTRLLNMAGSVQQLEEQFHRPVYDIKREITQRYEEQQYARNMRSTLMGKVKITPGETERFVNGLDKDSIPVIPPQYVYSQITKLPSSTEDAKMRAREQLIGLRERIVNGTRFDVLARMYSEDGSSVRGGELDPTASPSETFVGPFARALEKLRPGQVSEVVETEYGFHIIQLISKDGGMYHSRHILVRPQFTDAEMAATAALLDSVRNEIVEGKITFENAALEYSDDKYSKMNGGLVSNLEMLENNPYMQADAANATTKHSKEDLSVADFRAIERLKPGEISPAFATQDLMGNKLAKIIRLDEVIETHQANLKDDYLILEAAALREKQLKALTAWIDAKIGGMFVRIEPEFRLPEEFTNKNWLK